MHGEDIPAGHWDSYLKHFSGAHAFTPIRLEVHDPEYGPSVEVSNGIFREMTMDSKQGHPQAIVISVGDSTGGHLNHIIHEPQALQLQTADNGADRSLLVEAADGTFTIVRLRRPLEVVPGLDWAR
jgi:hypothetical protein